MNKLKSLFQLLGEDDNNSELYLSDQKKRSQRGQKGRYSRTKGLFSFLQLIKSWEEIVGKLMSENTIPLKIKGNTLFISAKHAIFAQELGFLSPMIIEKVNSAFPDIHTSLANIKFVHSKFSSQDFSKAKANVKSIKESKPSLHPYSPEFRARKAQAHTMFDNIEDQEIKKMLIDFMLK